MGGTTDFFSNSPCYVVTKSKQILLVLFGFLKERPQFVTDGKTQEMSRKERFLKDSCYFAAGKRQGLAALHRATYLGRARG